MHDEIYTEGYINLLSVGSENFAAPFKIPLVIREMSPLPYAEGGGTTFSCVLPQPDKPHDVRPVRCRSVFVSLLRPRRPAVNGVEEVDKCQ
ncbi:hypothetical protein EVAR_28038_1 [Eumeta japonica]|uniref:Uncharacterized protein n=1 Tax=Eumeta variegata TaxID=151549 RepID=A0A4C1W7F8_EUMVA|nr:hypothetical protein EVAR_28038_1 [Eumeta japonica]